ncbi:MAG: hypothetical protein ACOC4F_02085 [bacterium]
MKSMKLLCRKMCGALLLSVLALSFVHDGHALYVHDANLRYLFDLPVGWEEVAPEELDSIGSTLPAAHFQWRGFRGPLSPDGASPDGEALLLPGTAAPEVRADRWSSDTDIPDLDLLVEEAAEVTDATGEAAVFEYYENEALFAEVGLERSDRSGYILALDLAEVMAVVVVSAPTSQARSAQDLLLSVVDALGPEEPMPGPVAMFFESDSGGQEWPEVTIRFPGPSLRFGYPEERVVFRATPGSAETGDLLVGREARLLAGYEFAGPGESRVPAAPAGATADPNEAARHAPEWLSAWRRYFRLLYRDTYPRLSDLAGQIEEYAQANRVSDDELPDVVLSWLQAFEFRQAVNAGLFQPPVVCLLTASGDCDSLGMTYVALLHHLGYDAGLFVSIEHGHALVGVDSARSIPGPGDASGSPEGVRTSGRTESGVEFEVDERMYRMAELTTSWPLGSVARDHIDQADWHYVPLGPR